ncbi:hypothetical protein [Thermobaculum terrenum]|uniref:hypothetical protein n=1 Tax=Thermobaculum terrenum TaxID=166501 RepID=UPI00145D3F8E|nr:hypothetical protein [Thermobaculum terrenum]
MPPAICLGRPIEPWVPLGAAVGVTTGAAVGEGELGVVGEGEGELGGDGEGEAAAVGEGEAPVPAGVGVVPAAPPQASSVVRTVAKPAIWMNRLRLIRLSRIVVPPSL